MDKLKEYSEDLKEEIMRVKDVVNSKGYDNYNAFNQIVRDYRTNLKNHLRIVYADLADMKD